MLKTFLELKREVEELKRVISNLIRIGTVAESDPKRGYRIDLGQSYLSPWLAHPDSGGDVKTYVPLSPGQIVGVLSPVGDVEQGMILRAGFKKGEENPGQTAGENRFVFGDVDLSVTSNRLLIQVGETRLEITSEGIEIASQKLHHNGRNIGSTHRHNGVKSGGETTGEPT